MPLFEETLVTIAKPSCNGYYCTEHTRSGKCHFLRRGHLISELLFSWLQHVLHILGPENATCLMNLLLL